MIKGTQLKQQPGENCVDDFLSRYEMNSCRRLHDWSRTGMIFGTTTGSGDETKDGGLKEE